MPPSSVSFPKDPQPSVDRIEALARKILNGEILLPKFQRSFVWEKEEILMLLDSIAKGFPIGSVLLWESTNELSSEKRLADLEIASPPPHHPVKYVLDGQQRLSAICGALFWRGGDPASRWNIAYDLRERKFLHLESCDDPPLHQIRTNLLSDSAAFFRHVASFEALNASNKEELRMSADLLFNRFKDYKIATVTLADMPINDVAPIFERINSTGTTLTIVDLMRAATWNPDFDLVESIDGILAGLRSRGFEDIDRKVVLRNISVAAGGAFSAESIDNLRNYSSSSLKKAVAETGLAYEKAITFLIDEMGITNAEIIPYSNQLVMLAELFRRLDNLNALQKKAVFSWFWRSSLSGHFGGWNTGMMRDDLEAIRMFAEDETSTLTVASPVPPVTLWETVQFRSNTARAKLLALILIRQGPLDLLTGQPLDTKELMRWKSPRLLKHVFPAWYLKDRGFDTRKMNVLSNYFMLSKDTQDVFEGRLPSDCFAEVYATAGLELEGRLASQLIPRDAFDAVRDGDYNYFISSRSAELHDAAMKLM